jgi:hypothetical protein
MDENTSQDWIRLTQAKEGPKILNNLKKYKTYRVPAKWRDLLAMRMTFISLPKIDSLT